MGEIGFLVRKCARIIEDTNNGLTLEDLTDKYKLTQQEIDQVNELLSQQNGEI